MRIFRCERCGHVVEFSDQECASCQALLGYISERHSIEVLAPSSDPATYEIAGVEGVEGVEGVDGRFWR